MPSGRTSLVFSSSVVLAAGYLLYQRFRRSQPRTTVEALRGNFYATGTDVCHIFHGQEKVVVITGTTSGLGKETARLLGCYGKNMLVIMGVRKPKEVLELVAEVKVSKDGSNEAIALPLDLASFASVREFAKQVKHLVLTKRKRKHIDIVIHNAGVSFVNGSSSDGYQMVFQVNTLAPAYLTELLLPIMNPKDTRIIHISSEMHRFFLRNRDFVRRLLPPNPVGGKGAGDYALSKACQILQATQLCQHRANEKLSLRGFAIEPGLIRTNIGRHTSQFLLELEYCLLSPFLLRSTDQGCSSTLFCALAPLSELNPHDQVYYANCQPKTAKPVCTKLSEAQELIELYKKLITEKGFSLEI